MKFTGEINSSISGLQVRQVETSSILSTEYHLTQYFIKQDDGFPAPFIGQDINGIRQFVKVKDESLLNHILEAEITYHSRLTNQDSTQLSEPAVTLLDLDFIDPTKRDDCKHTSAAVTVAPFQSDTTIAISSQGVVSSSEEKKEDEVLVTPQATLVTDQQPSVQQAAVGFHPTVFATLQDDGVQSAISSMPDDVTPEEVELALRAIHDSRREKQIIILNDRFYKKNQPILEKLIDDLTSIKNKLNKKLAIFSKIEDLNLNNAKYKSELSNFQNTESSLEVIKKSLNKAKSDLGTLINNGQSTSQKTRDSIEQKIDGSSNQIISIDSELNKRPIKKTYTALIDQIKANINSLRAYGDAATLRQEVAHLAIDKFGKRSITCLTLMKALKETPDIKPFDKDTLDELKKIAESVDKWSPSFHESVINKSDFCQLKRTVELCQKSQDIISRKEYKDFFSKSNDVSAQFTYLKRQYDLANRKWHSPINLKARARRSLLLFAKKTVQHALTSGQHNQQRRMMGSTYQSNALVTADFASRITTRTRHDLKNSRF